MIMSIYVHVYVYKIKILVLFHYASRETDVTAKICGRLGISNMNKLLGNVFLWEAMLVLAERWNSTCST